LYSFSNGNSLIESWIEHDLIDLLVRRISTIHIVLRLSMESLLHLDWTLEFDVLGWNAEGFRSIGHFLPFLRSFLPESTGDSTGSRA
ncbi:hypothetical protein PENTCL1PPCAC_30670, partial [Pristionchus entomophagus]